MPARFYHPRYWLTWFGVAILRLIVLLPWSWQMSLGKGMGKLLYLALPARRKISCINLKIAFPERSQEELETLNRDHFISMGQGLIEAALGWWGSEKQISTLAHAEGLEHIEKALKEGPVILIGVHFSSLEVGARILAQQMPIHAVYRPHQNKLIEYLVAIKRDSQYGKAIPKNRMRDMIKSIKNGFPVWYATDQNYRAKGSILVPFFGVDAPTNPGTSRLARITGAKVIPSITVRLLDDRDNRKGYLIRTLPPLDNFPSGDAFKDTRRLNQILEELIREFPEQYLWTHKRYKQYASEHKDFYKEFTASQVKNKESACS
jgi:KDO2-lipid IV(A) lauroyltransferase